MLRSMELENFQSFSRIELDLSGKNGSVKNRAFIYGENGSGKSNLINAVFLLKVCSGSLRKVTDDPGSAGVPDDDLRQLARDMRMIGSEGPMKLTYTFSVRGSDAKYLIEFDRDGTLIREVLENKVNSRRGVLYRLEAGQEPYFVRGLVKDKTFRGKIKSEIAQYWGNRSLLRILNEDFGRSNPGFISENVNPNLLDFMSEIGSTAVDTKSFPIMVPGIVLPKGRIDAGRSRDLEAVQCMISSFFTRLCTDVTGAYFKTDLKDGCIEYELFFRKRISGKVRDIPASWESTGTKKMMDVMSALMACIRGGTVFIDEMDTGVHDLLISGVIEQAIPDIKGQLVATTHNTCLMEALDADSVYVIGVDMDGFKKIRCISSIERVRKTSNIRHKYYEGNFMGIPYIGDLGLPDIIRMGTEGE